MIRRFGPRVRGQLAYRRPLIAQQLAPVKSTGMFMPSQVPGAARKWDTRIVDRRLNAVT
jgi:hypothetical protein